MRHARVFILIFLGAQLLAPGPAHAQAVDVFLNVIAGGAQKLNIAIPNFTVVAGRDAKQLSKTLPDVVGVDLKFSALFSVVTGTSPQPTEFKLVINFKTAKALDITPPSLLFRADRVIR